MAKFNVTTPAPGHTGPVGNVTFVDGAAEVDEDTHPSELEYFRAQGYGVEEIEAPATRRRTPAKAKAEDAKTDGDDKGGEKPADEGRTASKEESK